MSKPALQLRVLMHPVLHIPQADKLTSVVEVYWCKYCNPTCRYKEDQQKEVQEAAERAKLASMTDEERRRWELENPKVMTRQQHALQLLAQHPYLVQACLDLSVTQAAAALITSLSYCKTLSSPCGHRKSLSQSLRVFQPRQQWTQ